MKLDKKFKFRVGLDVDDVLLPCTILAVQMANRDFDFEPPLTINEITSWNGNGGRGDLIAEVKIMIPKKLTQEEEKLFNKLKDVSKFNPRNS